MYVYREDYLPGPLDFNKNLGLTDYIDVSDCYNILFCGWSRSGKGVFINSLFIQDLIHRVKPENIIVFSPTFSTDKSFAALKNYLKFSLTKD